MFKAISPRTIGWEAYLHLVWLGFMVFQPIADDNFTGRDWLLTALLVAVFLPLYFWSFTRRGRAALLGIAGLTLLGMVGMLVNTGSSAFFIYAAAASAYAVKPRQAAYAIALILVCVALSFVFSPVPFPYRLWAYFPAAVFVPVIGGSNIFEAERARGRAKLRMAQDELEHLATIAERERIARDLHDLLGHTLSVITLKSELAGKLIDKDSEKAKTEIAEVERISREALSEVRAAVSGYRSKGLMAEVASAKLACEAAGVSFSFKGDVSLLTPLQESALSLVLREAVTNVIRHAGASRCHAALEQVETGLLFEIADNGQGVGKVDEGNGLTSIRERVQLLCGRLELHTLGGTRLSIHLPKEGITPAKHPLNVAQAAAPKTS